MEISIEKLIIQIAKKLKKEPEEVRRDIQNFIDSLYDEAGHGKNELLIQIFGDEKPDVNTFITLFLLELEERMKQ